MFSKVNIGITKDELSMRISDEDILRYYFNIDKCKVISSPFRQDRNPSFALYKTNGRIHFKDFATGETGSVYDMVMMKEGLTFKECLKKIANDFNIKSCSYTCVGMGRTRDITTQEEEKTDIQVRIRNWTFEDKEYWNSYGVDLEFLREFEIYPIDYFFINGRTIKADTLAYTYVHRQNGKVYHKIYQPLSKIRKWRNNYPHGTMSLIDYISDDCENIVVCSSVKDALCLWYNTGVPSIAPQGEGYDVDFAQLKVRFPKAKFCILYDNDAAGIRYSTSLSEKHGIPVLFLPKMEKGKDVSDLFYYYGKEVFNNTMQELWQQQ